jgi:hypothetical protein
VTSSLDAEQAPVPTTPEPSKNPFQRLAGVLFAPAETFEDIARKPDVLVPFVVLLLLGFICAVVMMPHVDMVSGAREAMEARGNMSPEDVDRALRFTTAFGKAMTYISPVISAIFYLIIAGVLLIAFRMFGGEGTYKQSLSVSLYGWLPQIIYTIILAVIITSRGTVPAEQMGGAVMSNLAFLVDFKEHRVLYSFLSSIDLFNIWTVVLLTLGMAAVSRLSRARSAAIVISLWVMTIVIKVGFAALGAARMKGGA